MVSMTKGRCHWRKKMLTSTNSTTEEEKQHSPVSSNEEAKIVGLDYYSQACKALSVVSPFDTEDGQKKSSGASVVLPGSLASCLVKQTDSRKRHKKSHLGLDNKKNKSSNREKAKANRIWVETEDYFREVNVEDVEKLNEAALLFKGGGSRLISIPYPGSNNAGTSNAENRNAVEINNVDEIINRSDAVVANWVEQDVNDSNLMEVDVVGGDEILQNQQVVETVCSLPQSSSGVEWLLGSRNKIYLTSERPSKKRKLLGGDAGLEKLFVSRPVKDHRQSPCCHYCSLGDMGNQLNRLIVCMSCGLAVHQRCYGVQQDVEAGCWLCSWCRLKRDEDKPTNSHCLLCPQHGGALKPVRRRGAGNDGGGRIEFAHLFCCQWMPELYIEDTKTMEPIMNIEGIKETQKKLLCHLCKVKCGACVRCSYGSCRISFHPVCAREARHRMEIWGKFGCDDVELRAFCSKHSEPLKENNQQVEKPSIENGLLDTRSNFKSEIESVEAVDVKGSNTLEEVKVSDSSNFTLLLKKLIDLGKVNLKDVAAELNVSANVLAANLADDCLPSDLHGKVVKWLKNHAPAGGLQKKLKLKVLTTSISKGEKESGVGNAIKASNNDSGNSPVKSGPPRKRTKGSIRVLKDNSLILSLKTSSGDNGVLMDAEKNGGNVRTEESSPDSRILLESSLASDPVMANTSDQKGDAVPGSSPSQHGCGQVDGAAISNCETRLNSNPKSHDCSIATADGSDTRRTEVSPGSYVHPLILAQNQDFSEIKPGEKDGCNHRNQSSTSTDSNCEFGVDLGTTKRSSILNMSPADEVEGELVYYQHKLLCNAVARKHISDVLISKVMKCLPQEIEAVRKQNWDAVLVSQYLSDLREVKKQGRKERRHKEAQATLAAATAAAAASSRLSSFRKDSVDESAPQENTLKIKVFVGRPSLHAPQVPRPKEAHPKLSVTWTSPEMNFDSSPTTLEDKLHSRVCNVCRRSETLLNLIIVCSSCKVAVHIDCYRSVKDSTGPWFCELCEDLLSSKSRGVPSRAAECSLCCGTTGAFRKTTDGQWVHAFCAEWVLESTFKRGQVNPIEGTETVSRGNDICVVCSRKVGVCIKCNYGHCQSTFHPTCGISAGFFMNVRTIGGKVQHKAYCEKHSLVERTKAETQKHGVEEWNSLKKVRVELERLRLICERIIRREKLKRELVVCSHDMLRWNRESISSSMRTCNTFVSPDVSSESATTSLRGGYTNSCKSCSETIQRSDDVTIDSTVAGKRRIKFPMAMDNDQKTDDSSTSQILIQTPIGRPILSGKQIPHRPPSSAASHSTSDDGEKFSRHGKHTDTFEKELVMTSDQASMRNQRLPKGFVYVPIRCLSNEEETIAAAGPVSEENSGQDE